MNCWMPGTGDGCRSWTAGVISPGYGIDGLDANDIG